MKRLTTYALAAGLLLAGSRSIAQNSLTVAYDFGLKEAATVATTQIGTVNNVLGKGFSLDVDAFAGMTWRTNVPVTGILVGRRFALADEVQSYFGIGGRIAQGQNFAPVAAAGASWRF